MDVIELDIDAALEARIDAAFLQLTTAPTPFLRRAAFAELRRLTALRSPRRRMRMEDELELRARE